MCVVCVMLGAGVYVSGRMLECSMWTCLSVWCLDMGVGGVGGWMYIGCEDVGIFVDVWDTCSWVDIW